MPGFWKDLRTSFLQSLPFELIFFFFSLLKLYFFIQLISLLLK